MIEAVLFDLGGTLIRNTLTIFETFQRILEQKNITISTTEIEKAFTKAQREIGDEFENGIGKIPCVELYWNWDVYVLKNLGIDNSKVAKALYDQWFHVCGLRTFPDVKPVLTLLKNKGIKMGIISNAYIEEIQQICEIVDLTHFFDIIVGSDTTARKKPHPDIFIYALRTLEITPGEAVFVGNKLEDDYRGAEKVGMTSFLIVREGDVPENVRYIRTLTALTDYIPVLRKEFK